MYKTYIMHYQPLVERYNFVINQLYSNEISNFEFITGYDREELNQSIIDKFYAQDRSLHKKCSAVSMRQGENYEYQEMTLPSISLNIKHIEAFKKTLEQVEEYSLLIEDDCRFLQDKIDIEEIILNAPEDMDVLVIGGAFDHNICNYISEHQGSKDSDTYRYLKAAHPSTNTTSSILYKKSSVNQILTHLIPFCLPIDWQLNHIFNEAQLNVYHLYPYISTQGDFRSTVND